VIWSINCIDMFRKICRMPDVDEVMPPFAVPSHDCHSPPDVFRKPIKG